VADDLIDRLIAKNKRRRAAQERRWQRLLYISTGPLYVLRSRIPSGSSNTFRDDFWAPCNYSYDVVVAAHKRGRAAGENGIVCLIRASEQPLESAPYYGMLEQMARQAGRPFREVWELPVVGLQGDETVDGVPMYIYVPGWWRKPDWSYYEVVVVPVGVSPEGELVNYAPAVKIGYTIHYRRKLARTHGITIEGSGSPEIQVRNNMVGEPLSSHSRYNVNAWMRVR